MAFTIGPHHATSTTPSKVNSFHMPPSFGYHMNGILLETRAHAMTRPMTMTPRGDDKRTPEIKTPKQEAWKRRRKKLLKLDRSLRSTTPESSVHLRTDPQTSAQDSQNAPPETTPEIDRSLRSRPESPVQTGVSGHHTGVSGPSVSGLHASGWAWPM